MSEQVSYLTPLITQLGAGGIIGLCIGYALKKIAKIVSFILLLFPIGFISLDSHGIINVDWLGPETWRNTALSNLGQLEGVLGTILANLPFAGGAIVGFGIGLKIDSPTRRRA
ncbi:hypothetical protein GF326_05810 [Candidatus Bathyarchaeota archaeon]|nr:hypothetical protein [Candidatus Bathyarchaeota archaeon]